MKLCIIAQRHNGIKSSWKVKWIGYKSQHKRRVAWRNEVKLCIINYSPLKNVTMMVTIELWGTHADRRLTLYIFVCAIMKNNVFLNHETLHFYNDDLCFSPL